MNYASSVLSILKRRLWLQWDSDEFPEVVAQLPPYQGWLKSRYFFKQSWLNLRIHDNSLWWQLTAVNQCKRDCDQGWFGRIWLRMWEQGPSYCCGIILNGLDSLHRWTAWMQYWNYTDAWTKWIKDKIDESTCDLTNWLIKHRNVKCISDMIDVVTAVWKTTLDWVVSSLGQSDCCCDASAEVWIWHFAC